MELICINDMKPKIVPRDEWVNYGTKYTLNKVILNKNRKVLGVKLAEVVNKHNLQSPYFAVDRFITTESELLNAVLNNKLNMEVV